MYRLRESWRESLLVTLDEGKVPTHATKAATHNAKPCTKSYLNTFKVKHGRKRGRKEKEADIVAAHDSDTSNSLRLTPVDASSLSLSFSPRSGAAAPLVSCFTERIHFNVEYERVF